MKKRIIIISVFCAFLFLVIIIACMAVQTGKEAPHTAVITLDGEIIRTIDLGNAEDETFTVNNGDGGYNVICIRNGEICVNEASCPDKICVKHGMLKSEFLPIICLPNRLVIELN